MIRKKLPDGSGLLEELPERGGTPEKDAEYIEAINRVASVFGKQKRSQTTADEHKMYRIHTSTNL